MRFQAKGTREHVWEDATVAIEENMVGNPDPSLPAAKAAMDAQLGRYGENDLVEVNITVEAVVLHLEVRKYADG